MFQEDHNDLRHFVEELAEMARTGQSLSIISGFHLAWWGCIVAFTLLIELYAKHNQIELAEIYLWPVTITLGWSGGHLLHKKLRLSQKKGALAYANRVTTYVWVTIGLVSVGVLLSEVSLLVSFGGRGYFVLFLLSGLGLVATAAAGSEPLLLLSGAGWILTGFASLFFPILFEAIEILTIIGCLIFLVLPGLIIGLRKS